MNVTYFIVGSRTDALVPGESTIIRRRSRHLVMHEWSYLYGLYQDQVGDDWQLRYAPEKAVSGSRFYWGGWSRIDGVDAGGYKFVKEIDKDTAYVMMHEAIGNNDYLREPTHPATRVLDL